MVKAKRNKSVLVPKGNLGSAAYMAVSQVEEYLPG